MMTKCLFGKVIISLVTTLVTSILQKNINKIQLIELQILQRAGCMAHATHMEASLSFFRCSPRFTKQHYAPWVQNGAAINDIQKVDGLPAKGFSASINASERLSICRTR